MPLRVSPVSRNLNAQIMLLGLEFEDLLVITVFGVAAMLVGQFFFSDRYLFFLPMNWALLLIVAGTSVPALMLLKYGKPRDTPVRSLAGTPSPTHTQAWNPTTR